MRRDDRELVQIELEEDVLLELFQRAHERGILLDQLVEEILINVINEEGGVSCSCWGMFPFVVDSE